MFLVPASSRTLLIIFYFCLCFGFRLSRASPFRLILLFSADAGSSLCLQVQSGMCATSSPVVFFRCAKNESRKRTRGTRKVPVSSECCAIFRFVLLLFPSLFTTFSSFSSRVEGKNHCPTNRPEIWDIFKALFACSRLARWVSDGSRAAALCCVAKPLCPLTME
jgi:hypothetical protein